jgi:hypothetical protein
MKENHQVANFQLIRTPKMIQLEGEITQTSVPPNKADVERDITIWIQQTENEIDLTFSLEEFQKYQFEVGDKLSIQIDKQLDIDAMARDFFKKGI